MPNRSGVRPYTNSLPTNERENMGTTNISRRKLLESARTIIVVENPTEPKNDIQRLAAVYGMRSESTLTAEGIHEVADKLAAPKPEAKPLKVRQRLAHLIGPSVLSLITTTSPERPKRSRPAPSKRGRATSGHVVGTQPPSAVSLPSSKKPARNAPCQCGSGVKFKRCCG